MTVTYTCDGCGATFADVSEADTHRYEFGPAHTWTSHVTQSQKGIAMSSRSPVTDLAAAIDANRPVLLMGQPGTAKTAMIEALAAERGAYLEVVIASAQDPTTILGIPMPTEDRRYTEPTVPGWARRIIEAAAKGLPTILFLDELTTVPESVAGPLLGVVQSRRADGWALPADCRIVAAANPPDMAVGGWALAPAMANRWVHIEWPAPVTEWLAWAAAQPSPALRLIAEYIEADTDALLRVPIDLRQRSGPWPSPRSWTNAAAMIDQTGDNTVAALAVGESAAETFAQWAALRDVPTVTSLLDGTAVLPTRPDAFRTALMSLAESVNAETAERTIAILRGAVATDAAVVAVATKVLASRWVAGIAPLVEDIRTAGIDMRTVAA